jgi:RimJ/RimL family protein N-acetyltransferase
VTAEPQTERHQFLDTARLILRRLTEDDVDHLVQLDSDPDVMRFLTGGWPTPREVIEKETLPRILACSTAGLGYWAAIEKATGEFVGWFELRPLDQEDDPVEAELGYRLRRQAWGRGLATEGARALVHRGFTTFGLRRVVAQTMAVNIASRRVMEKVGLTLVREYHATFGDPIEGTEHGEVQYALDRADWRPE